MSREPTHCWVCMWETGYSIHETALDAQKAAKERGGEWAHLHDLLTDPDVRAAFLDVG